MISHSNANSASTRRRWSLDHNIKNKLKLKGIDKQPPQILTNRATKIIGDISFAASFFSEMPEIARLHKRLLDLDRKDRLNPPNIWAWGARLRWEGANIIDANQSDLLEITNLIPMKNAELRIDFKQRSIHTPPPRKQVERAPGIHGT